MSRMRRTVLVTGAVLTLGLASCTSSSDDDATGSARGEAGDSIDEPPTPDAPLDTAAIDQAITDFLGPADGGVDVFVQRNGTVYRTAVGVGSNDDEVLEPGRPFRVGSISKSFVAVMVMQLVDEGTVDLDSQLSAYLPDTPVGADSSIRRLLSHQSGIASYTNQPTFFTEVLEDPTRSFTPDDMLSYIEDAAPGPSDQFAYSNTNYILLGQLIEQLDGMDLNAALAKRITEPLELTHTVFDTGSNPLPDDLVTGWSSITSDGDASHPYRAIATSAWSAGSLISSTDDLAIFLEALAAGELTSADSLDAMSTFGPAGYGLGLIRVGFGPTQPGVGHNGSIPGYSSTMAIDPASGDILVIVTSNEALVADQLAARIVSM